MIDKRAFAKIEYHLYHYEELMDEYENILLSSPSPADGMPRGSRTSDTTGDKVVRMQHIDRSSKWCKAIEEMMEKFEREGKGYYIVFINKKYAQKKKVRQIAAEMHCDRRTVYRWREEVVISLALKAATKGLVGF